jgi:hypothetical protein
VSRSLQLATYFLRTILSPDNCRISNGFLLLSWRAQYVRARARWYIFVSTT